MRIIRLLLWGWVSLLPSDPVLSSEAAPFTIEQVMSVPFPTELVAAPTGGGIAWVFHQRGERNIWITVPPDYTSRPLTAYRGDDGQELTDLTWSSDGASIVFTRGGDPNRDGEYPNPLSDPAGVTQEVWAVAVETGALRKLGEGHSAAVSPDGQTVAYIRKGQIWATKPGEQDEAEQLVHGRGRSQQLRWSPDGSRVAFVSLRGDHSFIGVYDVRAKVLRYVDPSVDQDSNPVWSPDGTSIAFLRVPSSRDTFPFIPQRAGQPWSIQIVEVSTGRRRQVWKAGEGRGSVFRNIVATNQILWMDGDFLVFPWEVDGWTHLYSVSAAGGEARLLTPGDFEVEYVARGLDGRHVLFNSNQDDIDRRHIWRVTATGGSPQPVTRGKGIEWSPIATSATEDGRTIAFFCSDAKQPAQPAVQSGDAPRRLLALQQIPGDFPAEHLVEPEAVVISSADGMRIPAQLFLPRGIRSGDQRPAAIFFHGGSRRQMLLGWNYSAYYHNAYALNQYLASRGYVVLSVNYRSGIGYGMEFREAVDYGAAGASEFNDVLGAGLYLRSRPDVDPERIALWGGSYGGYLTALGLARASNLFRAGIDLHGVHDWNQGIRNFVPSYDPLNQQELARRAFESSPMASVDTWRSPVLLIHGDDDRNVAFSQTVDLAERLRGQGVHVEQLVFPDEVHSFLVHAHWVEAFRATADFLDRHLKVGTGRTVEARSR